MPCYEAPPSWKDEFQRNAEQSVRLMCQLVTDDLVNGYKSDNVTKWILLWYIEHQKIDHRIATEPHYSSVDNERAKKALHRKMKAEQFLNYYYPPK
jgi:hypothetical protein